MSALVEHIASHLRRAICTYVEGDDTRATELTGEELRDIARAIIPMVLEKAAKAIETLYDAEIELANRPPPRVAETGKPSRVGMDMRLIQRGKANGFSQAAAAIRAIGAR